MANLCTQWFIQSWEPCGYSWTHSSYVLAWKSYIFYWVVEFSLQRSHERCFPSFAIATKRILFTSYLRIERQVVNIVIGSLIIRLGISEGLQHPHPNINHVLFILIERWSWKKICFIENNTESNVELLTLLIFYEINRQWIFFQCSPGDTSAADLLMFSAFWFIFYSILRLPWWCDLE